MEIYLGCFNDEMEQALRDIMSNRGKRKEYFSSMQEKLIEYGLIPVFHAVYWEGNLETNPLKIPFTVYQKPDQKRAAGKNHAINRPLIVLDACYSELGKNGKVTGIIETSGIEIVKHLKGDSLGRKKLIYQGSLIENGRYTGKWFPCNRRYVQTEGEFQMAPVQLI